MSTHSGVPGSGDLDSVMMDFGPDIDLLDDILGFDSTIDWSKLEPSLPLMDHAEELGGGSRSACGPGSNSSFSCGGPSPCHQMEEIGIPPNIMNLGPMTPEESIPSPGSSSNCSYTYTPSTTPNPPPTTTATTTLLKQEILTLQTNSIQQQPKPLQSIQPVQIAPANFNFGTMVGHFNTTPIFTNTTTAVLLPANFVLEQNGKVPVKRLEHTTKEPVKKKKEANRRSSHNAIERRYRSSINDKIVELRNLVCHTSDPNDKVHKAAILKSSIDTIRYLQGSNSRLDKENQELKKLRKCPNCGNSLRDLLTTTNNTSAPATPPTSGDESSSSPSPPEVKPNASPLALFAIATGLFLINPISMNRTAEDGSFGLKSTAGTGHSLVKRSLNSIIHEDTYDVWWPRIVTIFINLLLFIILYYFTGKIGRRSSKLKKVTIGKYKTKADMENIIMSFASLPNRWTKYWFNFMELCKIPFTFRRSKSVDQEKYEDISKLYYEYGKATNTLYPLLKSINYTRNDRMILYNLVQAKSKRLVKLVTYFKAMEHPLGNTKEGIEFLKKNLQVGSYISGDNILTKPLDHTELSQILCKYKEELFTSGIENLFNYGGGVNYLKQGLKLGKMDKKYTFWCTIMWVEIEWLHCGKRPEILDKLYQIIESNRQSGMNEPLFRAAYYAHKLKRMIYAGEPISKEMIDIASSSLKDSINTSTDEQPKKAVQLIWCLVAEWILECRLELWEDTQEINGFSIDLDTLRSLTHYVPTLLPSVYLYSACQRLMNGAAPSRTQQLLDATLRQYRTNPRTIRCNTAGEDCKGRGRTELNLIREKRKGLTLYLKCKYLPSQVLTCPGEKVGLLKEAVKTLEKIGETKKINNCLELIRTIGQNVTFH